MTDYLGLANIIAIHADQIQRYGGADGIRDPGQLEAALFRSQSGYYADLISEAAALWTKRGTQKVSDLFNKNIKINLIPFSPVIKKMDSKPLSFETVSIPRQHPG